jgi:hypothetical protein
MDKPPLWVYNSLKGTVHNYEKIFAYNFNNFNVFGL